MNPFVGNLSKLRDEDVEKKINDLSEKYFMTGNPQVKHQILVVLDMYKEEMAVRRARMMSKDAKKLNIDIDNLLDLD